MAEERLYIRIRGRVTGPFSLQQLKTLRDRGQFRRFHEISTDRQRWSSASLLTDLFAPEAAGGGPPLTFPELEEPAAVQSSKANGTKERSRPVEWHYVDAAGKPQGPVPQSRLVAMWQQGHLPPDTLVWRDGMADWLEITAPETGLGLVVSRWPLGLPLVAWISIVSAVVGVALAILAYVIYINWENAP